MLCSIALAMTVSILQVVFEYVTLTNGILNMLKPTCITRQTTMVSGTASFSVKPHYVHCVGQICIVAGFDMQTYDLGSSQASDTQVHSIFAVCTWNTLQCVASCTHPKACLPRPAHKRHSVLK